MSCGRRLGCDTESYLCALGWEAGISWVSDLTFIQWVTGLGAGLSDPKLLTNTDSQAIGA